MTKQEISNFRINCQNSADFISSEIGNETLKFVLGRYGASDIDSVSPSDLPDMFSELYAIEADLR